MPRPSPSKPLTIGAVLAQLREEFPEVSISKIRFLEGEGLLTPARSAAGYRHYRPEDVDRLRYILRSQRDHFWPLRVIKDSLEALDRGLTPTPASSRPQVPTPSVDPDLEGAFAVAGRELRLTRQELVDAAGGDGDLIEALEGSGLVTPDEAEHFDEDDLRVVTAVVGLGGFGLEARHLRSFRTVADREAGLIEQAVRGRPARSAAADRAEVARLCLQLHTALLRGALRS